MAKNQKPKKDSLITLTRKYANNHDECVKFFFKMKWPVGFYYEKCGCTHYYAIKRGDVFQCNDYFSVADQQFRFALIINSDTLDQSFRLG